MHQSSPRQHVIGSATTLPFRAVLTPHRSLSRQGFLILMAVLSAISFVAGIMFVMIGAWPVFGFFGLDVALVYLAFKINYREARRTETIDITRDELTVTRVSANGRQRTVARLNPTWTRLEQNEAPDGSVELRLVLRDRSVRIAGDLGSDERRDFAPVLMSALRLVRQAEWP